MKANRKNLSRRRFLGGAAAAGAALSAPWVWIPKTSFAQTGGFGKAKHVLIFYAGGGMRGTAVFNGDVAVKNNPYGIHSGTGTQWGVSKLFVDESPEIPLWGQGERLPSILDIADQISVLATVDHVPGYGGNGDGSHNTAPLRMATGYPDGLNSVLTFVGQHTFETKGGKIPPFVVGDPARVFGLGSGEFAPYRPVMLGGANDFERLSGSLAGENGLSWNARIEAELDAHHLTTRPYHPRQAVSGYLQSKADADAFLETFLDPALQVTKTPDGVIDGVTNEQLMQVFSDNHWGQRTALAVRLLQVGSPAVAIGQSGYDNHSNEAEALTDRIASLGRTLSGLRYVLPKLKHPEGGTYWDHTVVLMCTEFGRDNTFEDTGFNNGGGTDHHGTPASRYQTVPFMGGPVTTGGQLFGPTNPETNEALGSVFHSQSVLTTVLDSLGIPWQPHFEQAPISEVFG